MFVKKHQFYFSIERENNEKEYGGIIMRNVIPIVTSLSIVFSFATGVQAAQPHSVNTSVKKQLTTDVPILLPNYLKPVKEKYWTAKTISSKNKYYVKYYALQKNVAINSPTLNKLKPQMTMKGTTYKTEAAAKRALAYMNFSNQGTKINLGSRQIGYQDAGAGSLWTSWNHRDWAYTVHSTTKDRGKALEQAKKLVSYVHRNPLTIKKDQGVIFIDHHKDYSYFKIRQGLTVYEGAKLTTSSEVIKTIQSLK